MNIAQGEKTAVIICKYLTLDVEPDEMKQVGVPINYNALIYFVCWLDIGLRYFTN